MLLQPGTNLGPYQILGAIGAGGMGEVYRARDERLTRDVAVKILPRALATEPDRLRRFEQEARATSQLNHPNILAVFDTGTHEGIPYVVEELLEGGTLRERMSGAPVPPRKALDYARQVAQGLAAAHQKGIVHRDLKPENIFVTTDGRVKILDFGLAKLLTPELPHLNATEMTTQVETGTGQVLGTAGYMSPEQVRGLATDHRSDIFSFGSVLYEMITGRRAFQAASSIETMNAILKEEPPEISRTSLDIPSGIERIIQHCLEKSPDERFQSARDLAFQLEALSSPSATASSRGVSALPVRRGWRLNPALVAAAVVLAFALGWLVPVLTRPQPKRVDYTQLTFRKGTVTSSRFTPDGESVVYAALWDGQPLELFTARLGSPESRPMGIRGADILAVSGGGEMALLLDPRYTVGFQCTGTLARAPLSGGVPREVLDSVQDADWSPDGKEFVVAHEVNGRYRIEYPIGKVLYETAAWVGEPRISHDGQHIAFVDHPQQGDNRGRIAVVDLQGKMTPLTEPFASSGGVAWSRSGEEIWFTAARTGNLMGLYAVDLSGRMRLVDGAPANLGLMDISAAGSVLISRSDAQRGIMGLAPGETVERDLSWFDWSRPGDLSGDGKWLLFEEQGQGGGAGYSVYLRGTDGSPALRLAEGYSLALSPDIQWAATVEVADTSKLILVPRGAGASRTIQTSLSILNAVWLRDGRRLVLNASEADKRSRLFLLDLQGGAPRPLTPEGVRRFFAIGPEGESVVAVTDERNAVVFSFGASEPRTIATMEEAEDLLAWMPDGGSLLVARLSEMPVKVQRLDLATGRRTLVRELMPADSAGLIDVGWPIFSADTRSYVYSYRRVLSALYQVEGLQ